MYGYWRHKTNVFNLADCEVNASDHVQRYSFYFDNNAT